MWRRRRLLLWTGLLVALAVAGLVSAQCWIAATDRVTWETALKLRGATAEEAEHLFGRPPDRTTTTTVGAKRTVIWEGRYALIMVAFDQDEKVMHGSFIRKGDPLLARFRRWLGL